MSIVPQRILLGHFGLYVLNSEGMIRF